MRFILRLNFCFTRRGKTDPFIFPRILPEHYLRKLRAVLMLGEFIQAGKARDRSLKKKIHVKANKGKTGSNCKRKFNENRVHKVSIVRIYERKKEGVFFILFFVCLFFFHEVQ